MRMKGEEVDNKCRNKGEWRNGKAVKRKRDRWKLFKKMVGFLGGPVAGINHFKECPGLILVSGTRSCMLQLGFQLPQEDPVCHN